jgi:hypothetical protein
MINSEYYRLAEYEIIESKDGSIWWETHSGFCSVRMGRCFVSGSILFIESAYTSEENGFLKGEYLDQLDRLSKWKKPNITVRISTLLNANLIKKENFHQRIINYQNQQHKRMFLLDWANLRLLKKETASYYGSPTVDGRI